MTGGTTTMRNGLGGKPMGGERGAVLLVVLAVGVVLALVLFMVMGRSGKNRVDTVKSMKSTQDFYLADAGFNYIKTQVSALNREGGAKKVKAFMDGQQGSGWQKIGFGTSEMGCFRLESYKLVDVPLSLEVNVQGSKDPAHDADGRYESVQGVLRVPSLAKYARYIEGNSTLSYTGGTVVDGEILVAGDINLINPTVKFTRLVSAGGVIQNGSSGQYDFGFREHQVDIPTLNHVHVNSWDNQMYDPSMYNQTFQYFADNGGIYLYGDDKDPKNPSWTGLNGTSACSATGPCDTLFTGCYDTLSLTRRSPVVVAGSAVAIDLSKIVLVGDSVEVRVSPVIYDAGGDGKDYFITGNEERRYTRLYSNFRENAVLYFPGDVYLTGKLKKVPVTIVSGDDVFLYGDFIGPEKTEVDANGMPVTLGVVAQDRVYIHESSSKDLTIRAAILAENDEIIYDGKSPTNTNGWSYGYVCKREIFAPANVPAQGTTPSFSKYIGDNFIWDDRRVEEAGFGREPEEECRKDGSCPNGVLNNYGFAVLAYPRTKGAQWKLTFEGSLITRNPGSKGPKDDCAEGWDCNSDPGRVSWSYDDNLGVAYPPRFPAPIVDDRNPSQIIGFKRKSF